MSNIEDFNSARAQRDEMRERALRLPKDGGGGHDGGMPPEDLEKLKERVSRIEVKVDALLPAVTALGDKIDKLGDKIGGLAERVSTVEGQLKHIPTLTGVIVGQVVAAASVAAVIVAAISFGVNLSKSPTTAAPTVQTQTK